MSETDATGQEPETTEVAEAGEETTPKTEVAPAAKPKEPKESASLDDADPEDLKKEIAKLRRENAAKRTKSKEVEEAAQRWKEHVDSQKTELEKLQERNAELEKAQAVFEHSKLQAKIAKECGVDPDLADLIVGADEDEMKANATRLAERTKKSAPSTAADLHAGKQGAVPSGKATKWLDDLFTGN